MSWLYRYEAKGIQSWILATDTLKDLRGGSAAIEGLGDRVRSMAEPLGAEPIILAAGGGTFRVKNQSTLKTLASNLPMVLTRELPGLTFVFGWVEESDDPSADSRNLYQRLAEARNQPLVDLPEAGPWTARSTRTGLPAVSRKNGTLDAATLARKQHEPRPNEPAGPEVHLKDPAYGGRSDWDFEVDLHHRVWQDAPMAVVHADGNDIGKRVMNKDSSSLRRFSRLLSDASRKAAVEAVRVLHRRLERTAHQRGVDFDPARLPARPVVIGGDDFTFIVRADQAVPFTVAWLRAFERHTSDEGLTACAGIAFVRTGFPFAQAHEIAEKCCKRAKDHIKRSGGGSALCFARVTNSLSDDHDLTETYPIGQTHASLATLYQLQSIANACQNLPTGKLREWVGLWTAPDGGTEARALWNRTAEIAQQDQDSKAEWAKLKDKILEYTQIGGSSDKPSAEANRLTHRLISDALAWLRVQPMSSAVDTVNHPEIDLPAPSKEGDA